MGFGAIRFVVNRCQSSIELSGIVIANTLNKLHYDVRGLFVLVYHHYYMINYNLI